MVFPAPGFRFVKQTISVASARSLAILPVSTVYVTIMAACPNRCVIYGGGPEGQLPRLYRKAGDQRMSPT